MPNWPVGTRSKGTEGISASLKTTPNSIGYIEYGYGVSAKLKMASLENKAGKFVAPSIESARATLGEVQFPENLIAWVPDPAGETCYPIATYTWVIAYKTYADANKAKALKDVLAWGLTDGQKMSEPLGYVPLPDKVATIVKAALDNIQPAKK